MYLVVVSLGKKKMLQAEEVGDRERIVTLGISVIVRFCVLSLFRKAFRGKMGGLVIVDESLGTGHWTGKCVWLPTHHRAIDLRKEHVDKKKKSHGIEQITVHTPCTLAGEV